MQVKIKGPAGREYVMSGPDGDHQVKHWQQGHFYECAGETHRYIGYVDNLGNVCYGTQ